MTTEPHGSTRRGVLLGVGLAGLGGALAGCSTAAVPYDSNEAGQLPSDNPAPNASMMGTATGGGAMPSSGSGMGSSSTMTTGTVLGEAKEIPVGGGKIFTAAQVVVTQPVKGKYLAFSAVCTHVGCILNKISNGTIDCPCHGGQFAITTGAVTAGPPPAPLPKKKVKVVEGKVVLL